MNKLTATPPLIPAQLMPEILGIGSNSTLRKLLHEQKDQQIRIAVHDRGILLYADTKEAYETLSEKYRHLNIPDREECWSIIHSTLAGETTIQAHLSLVADTALKLGRAVENILNMDLIQAAALLHDIKRKEKKPCSSRQSVY